MGLAGKKFNLGNIVCILVFCFHFYFFIFDYLRMSPSQFSQRPCNRTCNSHLVCKSFMSILMIFVFLCDYCHFSGCHFIFFFHLMKTPTIPKSFYNFKVLSLYRCSCDSYDNRGKYSYVGVVTVKLYNME